MTIQLIAVWLFVGFAKASLDNNYWPPYLKRCTPSDPDFKKCLLINANDALSTVFHGDRKIGIPDFIDYSIDHITIGDNDTFRVYMYDSKVRGLDHLIVEDIDWDLEKKKLNIYFEYYASIYVKGRYESFEVINEKEDLGKGDLSWVFTGGNQSGHRSYHMEYITVDVGGAEYVQIENASCKYKEAVRIDITNEYESLAEDDSDIQYWNGRHRTLNKDLAPKINKYICRGITAALNAVFYNFPLHIIINSA